MKSVSDVHLQDQNHVSKHSDKALLKHVLSAIPASFACLMCLFQENIDLFIQADDSHVLIMYSMNQRKDTDVFGRFSMSALGDK